MAVLKRRAARDRRYNVLTSRGWGVVLIVGGFGGAVILVLLRG